MIIFAVIGLILALSSGGLYVYRGQGEGTTVATPEEAVKTFLAAVFLTNDPGRLAGVVCTSWDAQNAVQRTRSELNVTDAAVSWNDVKIVTSEPGRASVSARLGLRKGLESQPSEFAQWRFTAVDESGWRVCEARPFVS